MAVDLCSSDDLSVLSPPGLYKGHGGPLMFHYVRRSRNKNMLATSKRPSRRSVRRGLYPRPFALSTRLLKSALPKTKAKTTSTRPQQKNYTSVNQGKPSAGWETDRLQINHTAPVSLQSSKFRPVCSRNSFACWVTGSLLFIEADLKHDRQWAWKKISCLDPCWGAVLVSHVLIWLCSSGG